jgi:hypothetical protein
VFGNAYSQTHKDHFSGIEPRKMMDLPSAIDQLSPDDKAEYIKLRKSVSNQCLKNARGRAWHCFCFIMDGIRNFVMRSEEDNAKRAECCGVYRFRTFPLIAVNTFNLMKLTGWSKTRINEAFSRRFRTIPGTCDQMDAFLEDFPHLKTDYASLRKWSFRERILSPLPTVVIPHNIAPAVIDSTTPVDSPPAIEPWPECSESDMHDPFDDVWFGPYE